MLNKRIHLSVPHMGGTELTYVQSAFTKNWLSTVGENIDLLESYVSKLYHTHCVALSSGTSALHLALKCLNVTEGDEVLLPSLTFVGGVNPVLYEKATPIFVDSERESWNLDPNLLEEFLSKRSKINKIPKVLCVVHLFGQSAQMDEIKSICDNYNIKIIEDAAESVGTRYKNQQTGTIGDIGIFSFNGNKIITSTSGGMLLTNNKQYVQKVKNWSTQARDSDPEKINNYIHSEIGYNYRLSNVLAGIARGQFEILDTRISQRQAVFKRYSDSLSKLPGIYPQKSVHWSNHTRWLSCFIIDPKQFGMKTVDLIRLLDGFNIESRPVWKPMHTQPLYSHHLCLGGDISDYLNKNAICLPSSSNLSWDDQDYIISKIKEAHYLN
jgi:pyridoxal phosphate-dependent aminotransferase EpsN